MAKKGEIEGWAMTTLDPWRDRHFFVAGKVLPLCNQTVSNRVLPDPKAEDLLKCIRCMAALEKRSERERQKRGAERHDSTTNMLGDGPQLEQRSKERNHSSVP